jgi:EpsD family peptidyl-prolyl cis-trans isomerase
MNIGTRPWAAVRAGFIVCLCGLFLADCSKKAEVEMAAPKSQVVAKIGDQVVTVQELDTEFRAANVPSERRKDPDAIKRVLNELVARKYLVQKALEAKLDREPTVLLDILRSKDMVLANALVTRDLTTKSSALSKNEIDNYITNNPLKFAGRQIMSVEQISIPLNSTSQPLIDATKDMKSLDEVDEKLTAFGVQHSRSKGAVSSGDLPPELLERVAGNQLDDIFFIRAGANGVFLKVTGHEVRPLEGEAAINAARQYLRQDIMKSEMGMTAVAAGFEAKYEGEYSQIMGKDAAQPSSK